MTTIDNGVNVQALLDAREVLAGAPEAAQFTWRASSKWENGVHSTTTIKNFFGLGEEQSHKTEAVFDADHPEVFAAQDNGITPIEYLLVGLASCLTAGVASVAQNRGIQLRSVESTVEGNHDIRGILGVDSDVRNGFNDIKVTFKIDADASQAGDRGAGRPVPEALRGVRRPDESDGGHRRGRLRALPIEHFTTVVIGAGHAGLAASHFLTERSIDHVVLERGEVANSWRRERWDSLRLLTPNWQSRLPGVRYDGPDPDGYMTSRRGRRADRSIRRARSCSGPDGHERHLGAAHRRRLRGHDEPRRDPVAHGASSRAEPATGRRCRRSQTRCRRTSSS